MDIIHVIGKVGAGKTTFIKKYLYKFEPEIFDIKDIYREFNFSPEQLQGNYSQFAHAIDYKIGMYIDSMKGQDSLFIIESSGLNKALNESLSNFSCLNILVVSSFSDIISKVRSYADSINELFDQEMAKKKVVFDVKYLPEIDSFTKPIDLPYNRYFKLLKIHNTKSKR